MLESYNVSFYMENTNPIQLLRTRMQQNSVAAVIVPGTDPHSSEYMTAFWQEMNYLSGFTGEAGTLVVTHNKAALWTDSRYYLQAPPQIEPRGIELMKEGEPTTPTINQWLTSVLQKSDVVSVNPLLFSVNQFLHMADHLSEHHITLAAKGDFVEEVWGNRPTLPDNKIFEVPTSKTGCSVADKLQMIRTKMEEAKVGAWLATQLDDIAWSCNLRGSDIPYNPVFMSYLLIEMNKATLYVNTHKVPTTVANHLSQQGISIKDYDKAITDIATLNTIVGIDYDRANYALYQAAMKGQKATNLKSPVTLMKGIKNKIELAGFRKCMIRDGVALAQTFCWLEHSLEKGTTLTELDIVNKLHENRSQQQGYVSESFATISATGEHGAIVHYEPTEESNTEIKNDTLLLIDSGAQYIDGTTDITRTISCGRPNIEQRTDYTLVFKGMVALSQAQFPKGTRGAQLDILARQYLWKAHKNYGHGTGHGVGHFLNVHEGPHSIRMQENPTPLVPGMVMSNEPGYYAAGSHGVRIENLIAVVADNREKNNNYLQFETLTLCPIDTKALVMSMLTDDEINWLNTYHNMVYKRLSPHVDKETLRWLTKRCRTITHPKKHNKQ